MSILPRVPRAALPANGRRSPLSLSTSHISAPLRLRVAHGGSLAELKGTGFSPLPDDSGRRGVCLDFTSASRRRLLRWHAGLDRRAIQWKPVFITLTYPGDFEDSPTRWKKDLDTFCQSLTTCFPDAFLLWRMEYQSRGAPHFHLMVYNVQWLVLEDWRAEWQGIVGNWPAGATTQGFDIRRCKHWGQSEKYLAKYLAKKGEGPTLANRRPAGRHWGVRGRRNVPTEIEEVELCPNAFQAIRRVTRSISARTWQGNRRPRTRYQGGWVNVRERTQAQLLVLTHRAACPDCTPLIHSVNVKLAAPIFSSSWRPWPTTR